MKEERGQYRVLADFEKSLTNEQGYSGQLPKTPTTATGSALL
jgi:hypothetical protein